MTVRVRGGVFIAAGITVAAVLAFFVSPSASSQPDGLNRVAIDKGFDTAEEPHALEDLPTAGYGIRGIDDERLSTGLAGLLGVTVTFAIAGGVCFLIRRTNSGSAPRPGEIA
ncbi:MAG: PDGLE domain-containing protein [Actinobacteria bacterium]|nr:PDGLE domain-containing protein [Actinomycetota bacterium]